MRSNKPSLEDRMNSLQQEMQEMFDSFCEMRDRALDGDAYSALYHNECKTNKENMLVIAKLAKSLGLNVGVTASEMGRFLSVDLPSGQISWSLLPSEASELTEKFGRYDGIVDIASVEEQSRRKISFEIT